MEEITSFSDLKNQERVISLLDFQVLQIHDENGRRFLSDLKKLWGIYHFKENDFLTYEGSTQVGEYDKDCLWM